jgi:methylenetetrahydrofolate dehydrogenase (NADP+)/methenyltetrahydrofolate cyclohydrolase
MTAKILDGKAVAAKERTKSAARAADFISKFGRAPGRAVVKVGEDPASAVGCSGWPRTLAALRIGSLLGRFVRVCAHTPQDGAPVRGLVGWEPN